MTTDLPPADRLKSAEDARQTRDRTVNTQSGLPDLSWQPEFWAIATAMLLVGTIGSIGVDQNWKNLLAWVLGNAAVLCACAWWDARQTVRHTWASDRLRAQIATPVGGGEADGEAGLTSPSATYEHFRSDFTQNYWDGVTVPEGVVDIRSRRRK